MYFDFSICCPGSSQGISRLSCRDRQISPTQPLTGACLTPALMSLLSVGPLYQKIHRVLILPSTLWWSGRLWGRRAWGSIPKPALQQVQAAVGVSAQRPELAGHVGALIHPTGVTSPPHLAVPLPGSCVTSHPTPGLLPEPPQGRQDLGLLSEPSVPRHLNPWSRATPSDKFITYSLAFLLKFSSGNNSPMSDTVTN